jgi:hypothetical protein
MPRARLQDVDVIVNQGIGCVAIFRLIRRSSSVEIDSLVSPCLVFFRSNGNTIRNFVRRFLGLGKRQRYSKILRALRIRRVCVPGDAKVGSVQYLALVWAENQVRQCPQNYLVIKFSKVNRVNHFNLDLNSTQN